MLRTPLRGVQKLERDLSLELGRLNLKPGAPRDLSGWSQAIYFPESPNPHLQSDSMAIILQGSCDDQRRENIDSASFGVWYVMGTLPSTLNVPVPSLLN